MGPVLIDEPNATHIGYSTDFTNTTLSMHFYDSMAIFEKGRHGSRKAITKET